MLTGTSARAAMLLPLFVCLAPAGCYTRLTTPKEAINYLAPDGSPLSTFAVLAPAYNAYLKQKEAEGTPTAGAYRLQPGTRIRVEVWGHGIASTLNIRPDGVVDLPLIGDVKAEGKTIAELKSEIAQRYQEFYVTAPQIILNTEVSELQDVVRAGDVSVLSATGASGVVNLTGDEYLSQVIAEVRGIRETAEWNEIAVIRKGLGTDERFVIVSDIERLLRNGEFEQDVRMRNGDIVFIPNEKNTLLQEIFASIGVFADLVSDANTITDYVDRVEAY